MTTNIACNVVTLLGTYIPGYKAGGPIRSIANLVAALGEEFRFNILTSDRDIGERLPYSGVVKNRWVRVGKADVMYLSSGWGGLFRLTALLRALDTGSVLYLNSYFSVRFSIFAIFLHWLGMCNPKCIVLAPRGELSQGALNLKRKKKRLYTWVSARLGFYRRVIWHASTTQEDADIRHAMPNLSLVHIADLQHDGWGMCESSKTGIIATAKDMQLMSERQEKATLRKCPGQLRAVFVSRISPMKNLLYALRVLHGVSGDVSFDIYGPLEDIEYWNQCKKEIGTLPPNVRVKYMGMVEHERVREVCSEHDLFLLPTLGENFGHVICEALSAGCPVLISDQTPWRNLQEQGVGWDIPLEDPERFRTIIQQCVGADEEWYAALVDRATEYAKMAASDPAIIEDNRRMFRYATAGSREA
jgi:glycosyltransferase involved in cell wall biosynthesis